MIVGRPDLIDSLVCHTPSDSLSNLPLARALCAVQRTDAVFMALVVGTWLIILQLVSCQLCVREYGLWVCPKRCIWHSVSVGPSAGRAPGAG